MMGLIIYNRCNIKFMGGDNLNIGVILAIAFAVLVVAMIVGSKN